MRKAFSIVALILAFTMMPGAVEVVKGVVDAVASGERVAADDVPAQDGCPYQLCTCHGSLSVMCARPTPPVAVRPAGATPEQPAPTGTVDSGFVSQLYRPPRV